MRDGIFELLISLIIMAAIGIAFLSGMKYQDEQERSYCFRKTQNLNCYGPYE